MHIVLITKNKPVIESYFYDKENIIIIINSSC